jgi:hypothetical protein
MPMDAGGTSKISDVTPIRRHIHCTKGYVVVQHGAAYVDAYVGRTHQYDGVAIVKKANSSYIACLILAGLQDGRLRSTCEFGFHNFQSTHKLKPLVHIL